MIDYINGWTTEQLKHSRDHFKAVGCVCVICAPILETLCAELARREGEPMGQWETVTVRADEIKVGWRLNGALLTRSEPSQVNRSECWMLCDHLCMYYRHESELVVVERPIKTVTITVELSQAEAENACERSLMPNGWVEKFREACAEVVQKAQA